MDEANKDRVRGKVKFYSEEKGYGFIKPDGGGNDVFVHKSGLVEGIDFLTTDERVDFEVVPSDRKGRGDGKKASNVRVSIERSRHAG